MFGPTFLWDGHLLGTQDSFAFLWDLDKTKWGNGLYIQFRQSFAKETFSYDEHFKS